MRLLPRGRVRLAALVVVVVGLAAGGIAYASIPDGSGVIHACYKTNPNVGNLRVIDPSAGGACNPAETALDWSQAGTGASVPDAWDATSTEIALPKNTFFTATTVVSLSLPAGNYFVAAKAAIIGGVGFVCELQGPGGVVLDSSGGVSDDSVTLPVQSTVSLPSGGTVVLGCKNNNTLFDGRADGHINAIQVGTLH